MVDLLRVPKIRPLYLLYKIEFYYDYIVRVFTFKKSRNLL